LSVVELLVASALGAILLGMGLGSAMANRYLLETDSARVRANQNVRGALDLLSLDIRQAGERLPESVPAVEIIDGATTADPDELVLRRNILDEILTVCEDLTAGDTPDKIYLSSSSSGAAPACVYGSQIVNYTSWANYRSDAGGAITAYIYNLATKQGEFIELTGETDNGSAMYMERTNDALQFDYEAENSAIYLMIEWRYRMSSDANSPDVLELVQNGDDANAAKVTFGISQFQVSAILQDNTVMTTFGAGDNWGDLKSVEVSISGTETHRNGMIETTFTSRFFPRNVLSL
jgi:hypothetical protein